MMTAGERGGTPGVCCLARAGKGNDVPSIALRWGLVLAALCAALLAAVGALALPALSPAATAAASGRILFVRDGNLWLHSDGAMRQLTAGAVYRQPSWSPDGTTIAVAWVGENHSDIVTLDARGQLARQWTRYASRVRATASSWAFWPAFAPDGRRIVFAADSTTYEFALWLLDTATGGLRQIAWNGGGRGGATRASWAPDGRRLAVAATLDGTRQIWILDVNTGAAQQLTRHQDGAYDPAWSPDGRAIAYVAREDGYHTIWLVRPDGSRARRVSSAGLHRAPAWSPDGRRLAYLAHHSQSFDLWTAEVRETPDGFQLADARQLTRDANIDAVAGLAWGPDR
jgi:TolB protein